MRRFALCLSAMALSAPAAAGDEVEWQAGLNLRPDLGVHPVRVGGGARVGAVELRAVIDPLYWTDGVADTDLLAEWWLSRGFSLLAGWRPTAIDLGDSHQLQHSLVIGPGASLPDLPMPWLEARVGFELAVLVFEHGGDLPSDGLPLDRSAADHFSMGAYLRIEYAPAR